MQFIQRLRLRFAGIVAFPPDFTGTFPYDSLVAAGKWRAQLLHFKSSKGRHLSVIPSDAS